MRRGVLLCEVLVVAPVFLFFAFAVSIPDSLRFRLGSSAPAAYPILPVTSYIHPFHSRVCRLEILVIGR